jgi:hypothetical protein
MYCRKCGKQIDYDAPYCKECQEMEALFITEEEQAVKDAQQTKEIIKTEETISSEPEFFFTEPQAQADMPVDRGNRKVGLGKAITSVVLAFVAYMTVVVGIALMGGFAMMEDIEFGFGANLSIGYPDYEYGYVYPDFSVGSVTLFIIFGIAIGLAIPALIMGIQSMKCFFKQKREGKAKPVATLVLGIVGMALSAITLFCATLLFISLFALI